MAKHFPVSLRLKEELRNEIQREAQRTRRSASQIIQSTLEEGVRLRRCPGIIFCDGPAGRRATIAGTGIDVWEVVRVFNSRGRNTGLLAKALPQLSHPQLDAALHYYRCYPAEVDERLRSEEQAFDELSSHPFVRPFAL